MRRDLSDQSLAARVVQARAVLLETERLFHEAQQKRSCLDGIELDEIGRRELAVIVRELDHESVRLAYHRTRLRLYERAAAGGPLEPILRLERAADQYETRRTLLVAKAETASSTDDEMAALDEIAALDERGVVL